MMLQPGDARGSRVGHHAVAGEAPGWSVLVKHPG